MEVSKLKSIDSNETGKYCDQVRYLQKRMALKYGNVTRSGPKYGNVTRSGPKDLDQKKQMKLLPMKLHYHLFSRKKRMCLYFSGYNWI